MFGKRPFFFIIIFIASKTKFINFPNPQEQTTTVRDAISDLAYLESGEGNILSDYLNNSKSDYQKMLRGKQLQYHKASEHSQVAIDKLKMIPPDKLHQLTKGQRRRKLALCFGSLERDIAGIAEKGSVLLYLIFYSKILICLKVYQKNYKK